MISRLLLLLLCATVCLASPLTAAEYGDSAASSSFSGSLEDDQFDADFGDGNELETNLISDPLEGVNRSVFWVNDKLYFYLFKPVARGYRLVTPRPARTSVHNFFSNLTTPARAINSLLQFKFYDFGTELYRLIVNSTVGLGGLFDPAETLVGLKRKDEDFGQTLGYYGAGHGFYLVLPLFGPSSLRDGSGMLADSFFGPLHYLTVRPHEYLAIHGLEKTNRLALDRDTYEGIIRDAIDPYLFIRAAYAQRRRAQIGKSAYNTEMNILNRNRLDGSMLNPLNWPGK